MAPRSRGKRDAPPVFLDEHSEPWDRQPGEGDKAWQCFQMYRDLPYMTPPQPRTQREVSARMYPLATPTQGRVKEVGSWSVKWRWAERCAAYDTMLDRQKQDTFLDALRRDTEVNIAVYRTMRSKAARALAVAEPEGIIAKDAARMADIAITGLRREAGLATEIAGSERDDAFAAWLTGRDEVPNEWQPDEGEAP
jgi:hypothetical protein